MAPPPRIAPWIAALALAFAMASCLDVTPFPLEDAGVGCGDAAPPRRCADGVLIDAGGADAGGGRDGGRG